MNNTPLCVGRWQKYHIFFILSSIDTQIFFYILAVANNAAITMWYMYLFELMFLFFGGKYPEVEFLDHIVVLFFIFLCVCKNFIPFLSGCPSVQHHQWCTKTWSLFLHIVTKMSFLVFLEIAILKSMRWYFIVVLICISTMINNIEHLLF